MRKRKIKSLKILPTRDNHCWNFGAFLSNHSVCIKLKKKRLQLYAIHFLGWFSILSFIQCRVQSQSLVSILLKMLILLYKALTLSPAAHSSGLSQPITWFLFLCDSFCETLKFSYLLLLCADWLPGTCISCNI